MNNWKETTLSDVARVNELSIDRNFSYTDIEYIDIASVENREVKQIQYLKLVDAPSRARRIVRDNDILISTVRPNLKHFCFIKKANYNTVASTGFAVVTAKTADPYYLYYLLTRDEYTDYLTKIADGQTSAYPAFNSDIIEQSKFLLPPLKEQKEIAAVLSSLDNKIELLRRQNETLEKIAQTLFKRWFVEFNFPDANGQPYKETGGKMINSELGEIPEGWMVGKLADIIEIRNGFAFKSEDYVNCGIPVVRTTNFTNDGSIIMNEVVYLTKEKAREFGKFQLSKFDFLLVMVGASIGKIVIVPSNILPALQNQNMWNFMPKNETMRFYNVYLLRRLIEEQANSASGSARDFFRKDHFYALDVLLPEKAVIENFQNAVSCLFEKIDCNLTQINKLASTRDSLLPKLMRVAL